MTSNKKSQTQKNVQTFWWWDHDWPGLDLGLVPVREGELRQTFSQKFFRRDWQWLWNTASGGIRNPGQASSTSPYCHSSIDVLNVKFELTYFVAKNISIFGFYEQVRVSLKCLCLSGVLLRFFSQMLWTVTVLLTSVSVKMITPHLKLVLCLLLVKFFRKSYLSTDKI